MAVDPYPEVVDQLMALVPASLPAGVEISDGMSTSNSGADFLEVGVPSITPTGPLTSGTGRKDWRTVGMQGAQDDLGEVRCVAAATSQDGTVKDARDRAAAIMEAVATVCRSNRDLGIDALLWTLVGTERNWVLVYEKGKPPAVAVEFTITYRARI